MTAMVLDSSAFIAYLFGEKGAETVEQAIPGKDILALSVVNLAEMSAWFSRKGMEADLPLIYASDLGIDIYDMTIRDAVETGRLADFGRSAGLSLGDRACLALGLRLGAQVFTADRAWSEGVDWSQFEPLQARPVFRMQVIQIR